MIESNNDTIENHREDSVVKKAEMAQLLEAAKPGELPLIGRRGADTPSAHFLRLHAAHLQYIGEDPATNLQGGGGGGGPARTQSTARPVRPHTTGTANWGPHFSPDVRMEFDHPIVEPNTDSDTL